MMGSAERERLNLLKTVAQSRKEIQVLYTLSTFGSVTWSEQHFHLNFNASEGISLEISISERHISIVNPSNWAKLQIRLDY